jgi:LysR family transcriptional regulator, glycine cleavage system transcriptional activator
MTERIPPLAALRAFATVARHGSFARAALALHVSTSAVSHQIRGLEASLGTRLLTRARNGAGHTRTAVTSEGESLLRAVEASFAQLATACETVRERARGSRPMLAISANGSVASLWLAPRLAAFAALHPSVQWQVRAIEEEPDMIREGLDLAILRVRPGNLAEGDRLLFSEIVFPVSSPSLSLVGGVQDLLRYNLLQEDHGSSREKAWSTWLQLLGIPAGSKPTIVRFDTFNAAIGAAIAGAGIALGRRPMIDFELATGRLKPLFPDRSMPGSWDFIIRGRPDAARDVHVSHLRDYLLLESSAPAARA